MKCLTILFVYFNCKWRLEIPHQNFLIIRILLSFDWNSYQNIGKNRERYWNCQKEKKKQWEMSGKLVNNDCACAKLLWMFDKWEYMVSLCYICFCLRYAALTAVEVVDAPETCRANKNKIEIALWWPCAQRRRHEDDSSFTITLFRAITRIIIYLLRLTSLNRDYVNTYYILMLFFPFYNYYLLSALRTRI